VFHIAAWSLILASFGLSQAEAQYAGSTFSVLPYAEARRFGWEERVNNKRLLQEIGTRYSFGAITRLWIVPREVFFAEWEFCYTVGRPEYDGTRMDDHGTYTSYSATTAYSGLEGELLLGTTLRLSTRFLVTPVAGVGIEYWHRYLDYHGPYGYTEKYLVPSLDGGVRFTYVLETTLQLFTTFLVRYPLSISESFSVALEGQQPHKVVLHPGRNPYYKAGLGINMYRVFLVFSFGSWAIDRSDISHHYYQPDSKRQEYGVRVGYSIGF
jgi:hypothetical protein